MEVSKNRHAAEIRHRLLAPPNAVPDGGVELRKRPQPELPPEGPEVPPEPVPEPPRPPKVLLFPPHILTVARIMEIVAKRAGCSVRDVLGPSRTGDIIRARHVTGWLCIKYLPKMSGSAIARAMRRDHTTLMSTRNRVRGILASTGKSSQLMKELIDLAERDIDDCRRPAVPDIGQQNMEGGKETGIPEHGICGVGKAGSSSLDRAEEKAASDQD